MNVLLKCSAAALLGTIVSVLLLSTLERHNVGWDHRETHYDSVLAELQMLRKETRMLKKRLAVVEKLAESNGDQLPAASSTVSFGLAASSDHAKLTDSSPRNGMAEAPQAK